MADSFQSYKVTSNEQSSATKFNNLVQALEDAINSLDDANIAAAAAIAVSKLAAGSNGDVLTTTGGAAGWQTPTASGISILNRASGTTDVANTASETAIFSHSVTGALMSTDKMLRLTVLGDYLYNNVADQTVTMRVKFGGTTYVQAAAASNVLGADRKPWVLHVDVANLGANNSQMIVADLLTADADTAAPTTGIGLLDLRQAALGAGVVGITTLATVDTSTAQTLEVSVQWSAASANNSFRKRFAVLELV